MANERFFLRSKAPVVICGLNRELPAATNYPEHYEETSAFIHSTIPSILERASLTVVSGVETDSPPASLVIKNLWEDTISAEIINDLCMRPNIGPHVRQLLGKHNVSDRGLIERMASSLKSSQGKEISPHDACSWVPREWQPIIVERGILNVVPTYIGKIFESMYHHHQSGVLMDYKELNRISKIHTEGKFTRNYAEDHAQTHCLGKAATKHILQTTAFNYALKLQSKAYYISSIDEHGIQRPLKDTKKEYIALTS